MTHRSIPALFLILTACPQPTSPEGGGTGSAESTTDAGDSEDEGSESVGDDTDAESTGAPNECTGDNTRPSARSEIDAIWDAPRQRMVFFGGDQGQPVQCMNQPDFVAETWAFRPGCDEFDLLADGADGPSPRSRYAMAHDAARERVLIHGGRFREAPSGTYTLFDETWAFDLTTDTWSLIDATGPSPRTNHTAVVAGNRLLVFGGNGSNDGLVFAPLADLWALDLDTGTWELVPTTGGPSSRLFHAAAVTDDGATMFIYGGGDEDAFFGPFFPDLWSYDVAANEWALVDDGTDGPIGSIWGDLLIAPGGDGLLLWGAHEDNLLGNNNKLWRFDGGGWTLLEEGDVQLVDPNGFCDFPVDFVDPDLDAPERRSAGAAVVTDDGEMLVFGGKTDCGISDDVWGYRLDEGVWDNRVRATSGEICVRAFAEGCDAMCG